MAKRVIRKMYKKRLRASSDLERTLRELSEALLVHKTLYGYKEIDKMINDLYDKLDKAALSYKSLQNQSLNIQKGIEDQLYTDEDVEDCCPIFGLGLEDIDPFYYRDKHGEMEGLADEVSMIDVLCLDE